MPDLTYFTVEGDLLAIVGDVSLGDVDMNPDRLGVRGSVFFTPELTPGTPLLGTTLTPRPALLIPRVIEAEFDETGRLIYHGAVGVRLVANTSVLGLTGNFTYKVTFANMYIGAQKIDNPNPFSFTAPTSDVTINLVSVARVPGSTGVGMSRGIPGPAGDPVDDVTLTVDEELQFWVQGVPIGDPVPFPEDIATMLEVAALFTAIKGGVDPSGDTLVELFALITANTAGLAGKLGFVQAAKNPDLLVTGAITVDGSDLVTSAAVVWPDGSPGTFTITSRDGTGAVLEYNITYGSPVTKTYTQPTITRNANGAATNVPAIVVT